MLTPKDLFEASKVLSHVDVTGIQGVTSRPILIVPYYVYKNSIDDEVINLIQVIYKYVHLVKIVLVLDFLAPIRNNDKAQLETYKRIAKMVRNAGQYVAGYVYTRYAGRQLTQVQQDVDKIVELSNELVTHIFVDEVAYVGANYEDSDKHKIYYYESLVDWISLRYKLLCIGNPGTFVHKDLAEVFDLTVIQEKDITEFLTDASSLIAIYFNTSEYSDYSLHKRAVILRQNNAEPLTPDIVNDAIWTAKIMANHVVFIPNYTDGNDIVTGLEQTIQTICGCGT